MSNIPARDINSELNEGFDALEGQRKGHVALRTVRGPTRSTRPVQSPTRIQESTPDSPARALGPPNPAQTG